MSTQAMPVFTVGITLDTALVNEIVKEVQVPIQVFDGPDDVFSDKSILTYLATHLNHQFSCALVCKSDDKDVLFLMRVTSLLTSLLSGHFPILVTVHAEWDERQKIFVLSPFRERAGLGVLEVTKFRFSEEG